MTPQVEITSEQKWLSRAGVIQWIVGGAVTLFLSFGSFQYQRSDETNRLRSVETAQQEMQQSLRERKQERDKQLDEFKSDMKEEFRVLREDQRHTQKLVEELLKERR